MREGFLSIFQFSGAAVQLTIYLGVFALMAVWELAAPVRTPQDGRAGRWFPNLTLMLVNGFLIRIIFPLLPISMAVLARAKGWGILNYTELPVWIGIPLGIILLDGALYAQHVMFHALPALWRVHMVHHADLGVDLTTGLRYHPVEVVLGTALVLASVSIIGPDPAAVAAFEVALAALAMFGHGNVRVPALPDRALRWLFVTPDMHRVHHSAAVREASSNFGSMFSWWDRALGTYRRAPAAGHAAMTLGLAGHRSPGGFTLPRLITFPFTADAGDYAFDRHGPDPEPPADRAGADGEKAKKK